jgi:threonine aldolase
MLVGTQADMDRGRLYRKRLGGGMRQAGVLAAAGLIALDEHPAKLAADHANARFLAGALTTVPGITIDPAKVQTNIAIFDVSGTGLTASAFSAKLKERGVLMNAVGASAMRLVTHHDVTRADAEQAIEIIRQAVGLRAAVR